MPSRENQPEPVVYQMKVSLKDSKPPIWRRFQVTSDITLYKLHRVLQAVMGWYDSHLHQFVIEGTYYGEPHPDYGGEVISDRRTRLHEVIPGEKFKLEYQYDFGDSWDHTILVEKVLPRERGVHYPRCLKGKFACPPEDCGGIYGYYQLLETLAHPDAPDYEDMREWVGPYFDPVTFHLADVNWALKAIR